ncbi:MAG: hypothetical protein KAH44_15070, partial [Oricola sp.]|nr:hypothetical protein [Oricola sp.]
MRDLTTIRLGWAASLMGIASTLLLLISAYGYRQDWWPVLRALDVATWGAWAALAGTLVAIAALVVWARHRRGGFAQAL